MSLQNNYWYFKSALTPEECDKIIKLGLGTNIEDARTHGETQKDATDKLSMEDKTMEEFKNEHGEKSVDKISHYVRDSKVSWLNHQWLYDRIWPFINEANHNAGWRYNFDFAESFQFTQYNVGQFYGWHLDSGTDHYAKYKKYLDGFSPLKHDGKMLPNYTTEDKFVGKIRKLSVTINLNKPGEYDGGNLKFDFGPHASGERFHECEEIRPQGSIIVFPSHVYHQVTPVTRGTRYSLVLWTLGEPFK